MKAIQYTKYGSPDVLKLNEIDKPDPNENEVLIRIYASTVSAVDSIFRKGDNFFARLATGIAKPKNPIPGTDFAGEVEEVGKNVTHFKVGDKVFGSSDNKGGTHAEYICLPEDGAFTIMPAGLTYEEAAAVPYGALTALPFMRDAGKIKKGHDVLIIGGAGAIGTFAIQFAKFFDASATAVCSTSKIDLVKSLGAGHVVDYTKEDFTKNDKKYDIIFDTVGKSSFGECIGSLKEGGRFLTAYLTFVILFQMLWTSKIGNKKAIIAFTGLRKTKDKLRDTELIKRLVETGKIKPVIDKIYTMEQTKEAHAYVDSEKKKGNVLLTMNNNQKKIG